MTSGRDRWRAVMMFHRVVERRAQDHDVEWATFRDLILGLDADGAAFTTDLSSPPARRFEVALTFDDGTADHRMVAEWLGDRGIPAMFYVLGGRIERPGFLDRSDVPALVGMGHRVGSHGMTHRPLDSLLPQEQLGELAESRRTLEELTGAPVVDFAPPGGIISRGLTARLPEFGYASCRTTGWGLDGPATDRLTVPCLPMTEATIRRGWVSSSIRSGRLPADMAVVGVARSFLPRGTRSRIRGTVLRVLSIGR